MSDISIRAPISLLFFSGCPLAIGRTISGVIVYSLKSMFFAWAFSHIFNEVLKIVPRFAYTDTSASIVFIGYIVFIFASGMHITPHGVFWGIRTAVPDIFKTSAAYGVPSSEVVSINDGDGSAIANALPLKAPVFLTRFSDNCKNPVSITDFVFLFHFTSPFVCFPLLV